MRSYGFFLPLFAACVSAEAATRFTAAGVFGLDSSLPAVDATLGEVFSLGTFFVAMPDLPRQRFADAGRLSIGRHHRQRAHPGYLPGSRRPGFGSAARFFARSISGGSAGSHCVTSTPAADTRKAASSASRERSRAASSSLGLVVAAATLRAAQA